MFRRLDDVFKKQRTISYLICLNLILFLFINEINVGNNIYSENQNKYLNMGKNLTHQHRYIDFYPENRINDDNGTILVASQFLTHQFLPSLLLRANTAPQVPVHQTLSTSRNRTTPDGLRSQRGPRSVSSDWLDSP